MELLKFHQHFSWNIMVHKVCLSFDDCYDSHRKIYAYGQFWQEWTSTCRWRNSSFLLFLYVQGGKFFLRLSCVNFRCLMIRVIVCMLKALYCFILWPVTMQGCHIGRSQHCEGTDWTYFKLLNWAFGDGCLIESWIFLICDGFSW